MFATVRRFALAIAYDVACAQFCALQHRSKAMQTLLTIARADWSPALRAAAGRVAYLAAVLIVAAEMVYRAGMATGRAIHWLNDHLGGLVSGRYDRVQTARAVVAWARATIEAPAPAPAPAPPMIAMACEPVRVRSIAVASPSIETLTVAQLRKLARARGLSRLARNGKRSDLLSALTA